MHKLEVTIIVVNVCRSSENIGSSSGGAQKKMKEGVKKRMKLSLA
jgi:hypothetical protein